MVTDAVVAASPTILLGTILLPNGFVDLLDNSIREELQKNSDGYFSWVIVSAIVVAIGVAMEGPEVLHELWPRLFAWFTWTSKDRLRRFERAVKKIGLVGWLLVVIGVAGEGVFELLQNRAEGQLQSFNAILLKDARLTASAAGQSANDAADASTRAGDESDKAAKKATLADERAGSAVAKIGQLDRRLMAADAQLRTTEDSLKAAQSDLQDIEQRRQALQNIFIRLAVCTAPRVIKLYDFSNGQTTVDPLRAYAGSQALIEFQEYDAESKRAAENIKAALEEAKWSVTMLSPQEGIADGVEIAEYTRYSLPNPFSVPGPLTSAAAQFRTYAKDEGRSLALGGVVLDFLHANAWQATAHFSAADHDIPPGGIKIKVGMYPANIVFAPAGRPEMAQLGAAELAIERQAGESEKKAEDDQLKRLEAGVQAMSPQGRKEYLDAIRDMNTMSETERRRSVQPCVISPTVVLAP